VWWTNPTFSVHEYDGEQSRRLSSAPHWARVMKAGATVSPGAVAGGMAVRLASAAERPASTVTRRRSDRPRRVLAVAASIRTGTASASADAIGAVECRPAACVASALPASGPSSESSDCQSDHVPPSRMRTWTTTSSAR
jgi:hypothetical protein